MDQLLDIKCDKYVLENGLQVILYADKKLPITAVNVWFNVGSANEKPGKTGFAHLFEHMMFQGSQNVDKEMHFKFIQEAGGSLNGSTSFDRTNYFETVPSNNLELALWLESDRMGYLLPSLTEEKLNNQKEVVINERMQRYENQPYGLAWEKLFYMLFKEPHPYSWPTIGYMEDIKRFNQTDVSNFFRKFYSPSNASLVAAGNFEESEAKKLIETYFNPIQNNEKIDSIEFADSDLQNDEFEIYMDEVELSRIYLAWKSEKLYAENDAALDLFSDVLGGSKNSRLNKEIVFEKQLALDISCFQYSGKIDGAFVIVATAKPGVELTTLKEEILRILKETLADGVSKKELQRAKNLIKSNFIYSLQNITSLADYLNGYNCNLGNPNSFEYDLSRYEAANHEKMLSAANLYLNKHFAELQIIPKK